MVKLADDWAIVDQARGIWTWAIDGFVDAEFERARRVEFFEDVDVGPTTARVLDLCPAEFDVTFRAEHDCAFVVFGSCRWHAAANETLSGVEQHAVGFAGLFVFRDLTPEWIRSAFVDARKFQCRAVCHRAVTVGASEN